MVDQRQPFWNVIAVGLQAIGILTGIVVAGAFGHTESLDALLYFALPYTCSSLLGSVAGCLALVRHEQWVPLSTFAVIINGTPCLFLVPTILYYLCR